MTRPTPRDTVRAEIREFLSTRRARITPERAGLPTYEDFRVRWAAHDVRVHNTGVKKLHHPVVGDLDLPYESLPVEAGSTTSLVTYLPEPGSPSHDALQLLATVSADQPVTMNRAAAEVTTASGAADR